MRWGGLQNGVTRSKWQQGQDKTIEGTKKKKGRTKSSDFQIKNGARGRVRVGRRDADGQRAVNNEEKEGKYRNQEANLKTAEGE